MLQNGPAWFLVADGRRARLLTEARRGAALEEAWSIEIGPDDLYDPQDRPPRSFDRVGAGRHAMDKGRDLHEAEEEKFLKRVADRVGEGERKKQFDHLVIAAPPRALGCRPPRSRGFARRRRRICSMKTRRACGSGCARCCGISEE
jgi:protein required for attachment to host cells